MLISLPDISLNWNHLLCVEVVTLPSKRAKAQGNDKAVILFYAPSDEGRSVIYRLGAPDLDTARKVKSEIDDIKKLEGGVCDLGYLFDD